MTCSICYEDIREKRKLHCGHIFCATCISKWRLENASCPNCRQPISRRYFREKNRFKQNYIERVNRLKEMIDKIERDGSQLFEDYDELQWKRYQLYERLHNIEENL